MLEKPDIEDRTIIDCLKKEFGLRLARIAFLPLGADANTAVYHAVTVEGAAYFIKLRRGDWEPASVAVPRFLYDHGLPQVIPCLPALSGQLWAGMGPFKVILYPFVEGHNAFEVGLSDEQLVAFGRALKKFHTTKIPAALIRGLPRETFTPRWREKVRTLLKRFRNETFADPLAAETAAFLSGRSQETNGLVRRAESLASTLQRQALKFILCHGDIHGWNLLISGDGSFYMVDWDTLIFAPRERDLMFVGSGLGGIGHSLESELGLFYRGYGSVQANPDALAYYRYERIIEDIAVYCRMIISTDQGGADREQALKNLKANFLPHGTIEIARRADRAGIS